MTDKTTGAVQAMVEANVGLKGADLSHKDFFKGSFSFGDFTGANFDRAILEQIFFREVSLKNSTFVCAALERIAFNKATLRLVNFFNATIRNSDFEEADCVGTSFEGALLRKCNFLRTDLREVDFGRAALEDCDFTRANLTGTILGEAQILGCTFTNAIWNKTATLMGKDPVKALGVFSFGKVEECIVAARTDKGIFIRLGHRDYPLNEFATLYPSTYASQWKPHVEATCNLILQVCLHAFMEEGK